MKKLIAMLLALAMMLCVVACAPAETPNDNPTAPSQRPNNVTPPSSESVMTYAEYLAAAQDEAVEIEAYVQATQSWYNNAIKIYAQDPNGCYFAFDVPCTEEQAAKLLPGTKINIKGYKAYWDGMPEIAAKDAVLTIVDDGGYYIAPATDLTDLLGKIELLDKVGMLGAFKGMTIASISYKNDEPGDDIYVKVTLGENTYDFCVERWLTGPDTEVYKAFADLKAGDKVDIEGFVYWWDADVVGVPSENAMGINTHIVKIAKVG